jgi:hypothetical protein
VQAAKAKVHATRAKLDTVKSDGAIKAAAVRPAPPIRTETVASLRAKAREQGIVGYSRLTRDQLLAKVK